MTDDCLSGGCACGAVRFTARGRPERVGLCHCMTCRKAHSAACNPFVVYRHERVEIVGELKDWSSTPNYVRRFCPACGSRIAGVIAGSGEVELSIGSFDDVGLLVPQYENWVGRREPWLAALDVPQNQGNPG